MKKHTKSKNMKKHTKPHGAYTNKDVERLVSGICRLSKIKLVHDFPDPKDTPRDAHPKTIGVLKGKFTVNGDVPAHLQHGVFANLGKSYPTFIRFSNSAVSPAGSDVQKDFRGMALKLMDGDNTQFQDFILFNKVEFPFSTPQILLDFLYWFMKCFWLLPLVFLCKGNVSVLKKVFGELTSTLAGETFFSCTPFALGNEAEFVPLEKEESITAIKYAAFPRASNNGKQAALPKIEGKDYLREELKLHLKDTKTLAWDFCIQMRGEDKWAMSLNDVSKVWTTEFVKVATLEIEDQDFDTPERFLLGNKLQFNLKHYQPGLQPIGIMNRVRMQVYEEMSKFRQERAGIEPGLDTTPVN